jgi:hypothetical protein
MLTQESVTHERVARARAFTHGQVIPPNHLRGAWYKNQLYLLSNGLAGLAKRGLVFVLSPWIFWCSSTGLVSPSNQKQVFAALLGNVQRIQNSDFGRLPTVTSRLQRVEALVRILQQKSVGWKIPANYLYELALDARALGMVADAVSSKHASLARPSPGGPGRAQSNASGLVSAGIQLTTPPVVTTSGPVLGLFEAFFLAPGVGQRGPAGSTNSQVFADAVLGADQKARLTRMLDDVSLDLSDKVSFAGENLSDPFTPVKIKVTTRDRLKREVSGYEVWFAPKVLFGENPRYFRFDRPSSPTDYPLPPGNYVFWSRGGSARGPIRYCNDVGMDGLKERLVDPLLTP